MSQEKVNQEFNLDMAPKSMVQFGKNIQNGILAYIEYGCGHKNFLTQPFCQKCQKTIESAKWKKVDFDGIIKTYCVTYVTPPELTDMAPYISIIAEFGEGLRISAILDMKFDPNSPPINLIGKKIKHKFIDRPNGKIIAAELV
jgi:uncharacterized OB-fold protein